MKIADLTGGVQSAIITIMEKVITKARGPVRVSLSLAADVAEQLDALVKRKGAASRSAMAGEMLRAALTEAEAAGGKRRVAGFLTLLYNHRVHHLQARLTGIQHEAGELVIATLHVHLDAYRCMETLAVRGPADRIRALADALAAVRGVLRVQVSITALAR